MLVSQANTSIEKDTELVCPLRNLSAMRDLQGLATRTNKSAYQRYLLIIFEMFSGLCWKG